MSTYTKPRENPWLRTPFGAEQGIGTEGDVLINTTADGVDVNLLWGEVASLLSAWNSERSAIAQLLTRQSVNTADAVPQAISDESFEEATELGVPVSIAAPANAILLGSTLVDYDKAGRFSWRFLRDSTAEQIRAVTNYALAADNKLTNGLILRRLFSPEIELNEFNHNCYGLWTGDDGLTPPDYLGLKHDSSHNHYLVSGADEIDSGDLDTAITHIQHHGYGVDPNSKLIAFMNPVEADVVPAFRAGEISGNDAVAKYDWISSQGAPPYLLSNGTSIVGQVAPTQYNGLKIDGSYGPVWVTRTQYLPAGHFIVLATEGPDSPNNPVTFRQHPKTEWQGLRTIPGPQPEFPMRESFWGRTAGVGVRHRGAAVVTQIKASGSYEPPVIPI